MTFRHNNTNTVRRRPVGVAAFAALSMITIGCVTTGVDEEAYTEMQSIEGAWEGEINAAGASIGIVVRFSTNGDGTIDIPKQNARGLALENIKYSPPDISFDLPTGQATASFRGTIAHDVIEGSFQQGGADGSFILRSVTTPSEPPVHLSFGEPVVLETSGGDIHGSLVLPESATGPVPVVLIIAGSGPVDRDGNASILGLATDNLLQIAKALAEAGIGSLRYDKRGVGESAGAAGSEEDLRFENFIDDAAGWMGFLNADSRVDRVAVIGHSEGAIIGMAASAGSAVDAFVSVSGPGRPYDVLLREQLASQPKDIKEEADRIIDSLVKGETIEEVSPSLAAAFRPSVQPFLMSAMAYDPALLIAALDIPILVVQGTADLQVTQTDSDLLSSGGNSELLLVVGMNHVLKQVGDNSELNIGSYANPKLPLDTDFSAGIVDFLTVHLNNRRRQVR